MSVESNMAEQVRSIWRPIFRLTPVTGVVLILLLGIPRFMMVLKANTTVSYNFIPLVFITMGLLPFILLTKAGLQKIELKRPENYRWLLWSFLLGAGICVVTFLFFQSIYGHESSNAFVYISKSYNVSSQDLSGSNRLIFFSIYSIIGMTFSPLGEELFYRGLVHESFSSKLSDRAASVVDSLAFAITHLAHFGLTYTNGHWNFQYFPALLWVYFMYVSSRIFFVSRKRTGSIWGAVIAHAGFNLMMMYLIFYHIL